MKKTIIKLSACFIMAFGAFSVASMMSVPQAYADVVASKAIVDEAKAKGIIGEGNNGYLALVVRSADASVIAAMNEINDGRKNVFAEAAAKNGVSIDAAGAAAFTKIILPKVKSGEFYQDINGAWVKK